MCESVSVCMRTYVCHHELGRLWIVSGIIYYMSYLLHMYHMCKKRFLKIWKRMFFNVRTMPQFAFLSLTLFDCYSDKKWAHETCFHKIFQKCSNVRWYLTETFTHMFFQSDWPIFKVISGEKGMGVFENLLLLLFFPPLF